MESRLALSAEAWRLRLPAAPRGRSAAGRGAAAAHPRDAALMVRQVHDGQAADAQPPMIAEAALGAGVACCRATEFHLMR